MSYDEPDQRYYMVDDEDVADNMDGIDEEYHTADDANLDEYDMVGQVLLDYAFAFKCKMEVCKTHYLLLDMHCDSWLDFCLSS